MTASETPISIHDVDAVDRYHAAQGGDSHRLKRLRNAFYKHGLPIADAAREGSYGEDVAARSFEWHALELADRRDSEQDGASKLIFRTASGYLIETVILRIESGRTSLCVSSQVGCAANCAFCATGKMGVARDLAAPEILDQVVQAKQLLAKEGRKLRNVVFMGMGEPFHNEANLYRALEVLRSPRCFDLSDRKLLVSTVGIPDAMVRCARRFERVNLALSLHGAREEVRPRIVPLAKRYPLDQLRQALEEVNAIQDQSVMIEYVLLKGVNDTAADLDALSRFVDGLDVHVNLIPYNAIEDAPELEATPREEREAFAHGLKQRGYKVTLRYSLGADIAAACGQLVRQENRRREANIRDR